MWIYPCGQILEEFRMIIRFQDYQKALVWENRKIPVRNIRPSQVKTSKNSYIQTIEPHLKIYSELLKPEIIRCDSKLSTLRTRILLYQTHCKYIDLKTILNCSWVPSVTLATRALLEWLVILWVDCRQSKIWKSRLMSKNTKEVIKSHSLKDPWVHLCWSRDFKA